MVIEHYYGSVHSHRSLVVFKSSGANILVIVEWILSVWSGVHLLSSEFNTYGASFSICQANLICMGRIPPITE